MAFAPAEEGRLLMVDTVVLTHWRNGKAATLKGIEDHIARHQRPPLLASVVVFEAYYGIEKGTGNASTTKEEYRLRLDQLVDELDVVPFDDAAARVAAHVFAALKERERNDMWGDVLIAATAVATGFGLATENRRHFERIGEVLAKDTDPLRLSIWKL